MRVNVIPATGRDNPPMLVLEPNQESDHRVLEQIAKQCKIESIAHVEEEISNIVIAVGRKQS